MIKLTKIKNFFLNKKLIAAVYYKGNDKEELEIFQNYHNEYKKLIDFFGFKPPKVKIKLVYTRKEMDKYWGAKSDITAMVDNKNPFLIYFFSPLVFEKLTDYKKDDMLSIIIHETAHAFVTQINKRCFAWANEGLCEYLIDSNNSNNIIKKENWTWFKNNNILYNTDISWGEIRNHEGYIISFNLVRYIIKNFTKDTVIELLKIERVKNKNIKKKINKILGDDIENFLSDFEKTLKLK